MKLWTFLYNFHLSPASTDHLSFIKILTNRSFFEGFSHEGDGGFRLKFAVFTATNRRPPKASLQDVNGCICLVVFGVLRGAATECLQTHAWWNCWLHKDDYQGRNLFPLLFMMEGSGIYEDQSSLSLLSKDNIIFKKTESNTE